MIKQLRRNRDREKIGLGLHSRLALKIPVAIAAYKRVTTGDKALKNISEWQWT